MSFKKQAGAVLAEPVISMQDWEKLHGRRSFGVKTASLEKIADEQSRYLLSHARRKSLDNWRASLVFCTHGDQRQWLVSVRD